MWSRADILKLMRKLAISSAFLFSLSVICTSVVFAKSATPSAYVAGQQKLAQRLEKMEEKREEIKERLATKASEFREKRKELVKRILTKALERLSHAVSRLDKIAGKIQSRIDKLSEKGVDLSAAQSTLDGCKTNAGDALNAISEAKTKVEAITDDGNRDGTGRAAYDAVKAAKQAVWDYHKCLVEVLRQVKAAAGLRTDVPRDSKEGTNGAEN